jgi:hypothetical protein
LSVLELVFSACASVKMFFSNSYLNNTSPKGTIEA